VARGGDAGLLFFLAGRLLSGLMAGTGPIAQAAMMDRSSEAERGRNMSNVVLVNCVGLVTGPAVGGGLAHWDFRAPLGFAFVLCVLAFLWIRQAFHRSPRGKAPGAQLAPADRDLP
jgi:Arabinose efflux permease